MAEVVTSRIARWVGMAAFAALAAWAGVARAQISQQNAWVSQYANTAYPNGAVNANYTISAGTNRLLLVAIASRTSTTATQTVSVTYGGHALTLANGDAASSAQDHTYFYYLNDAGISAAVGTSLNVTINGGSAYYTWVYAAVFAGVNQTTPLTDSRNFNTLTSATGTITFSTALSMNANDVPIEIILMQRSTSGTTRRTIQTWAASWGTNTGASLPVNGVYYADASYLPTLYISHRAIPTATLTDPDSNTASSTSTYASMTGLSLATAPAGGTISIGQVADPTNTVSSGGTAAIDAFSVQTSTGGATLQNVTVTLGNPTGLSGVFLYSNANCTLGTQYGTTVLSPGGSVTFSNANVPATATATTFYVCGTGATVTASTPVTAVVASATTSTGGYTVNTPTDTAGTLTVLPVVTIGNGSAEPANSSITSGAVGPIDAFSVQSSGGTATITAIAVNLAFSTGTPLTNVFVNSASSCAGTTYGTLASPVSGANSIALSTNISATTTSSATNLYLCGTAATVAANATVTGTLSKVTASGYGSIDNDTTSATLTVTPPPSITIGNGSAEPTNSSITPGAVGAIDAFSVRTSAGNATITAVAVNLTFSTGTPLTNVFVNSASSCAGTTYGTFASPVAGTNTITLTTNISATTTSGATNLYVCGTAGTVGANATVSGTVSSVTATGYTSTSSDTTSATLTVTPPPSITIGNGSAEPTNSSIASGAVGAIDAFSVQTSAGNATITAVAVNLAFSAGTPLTNVFVNSLATCAGTTYGTRASPVAGANTITLTTNISATTTSSATNLYVCGTAATIAANATVTGTVSSVTATGYTSTSNDTTSATLTVTAPPVPGTTTGSITATVNSCASATASASYTGDTDSDNTVTFSRSTNGTTFTTLAGCTSLGGGTNPRVCTDTTVAASTSYWYRAQFADTTGGVTGTNPITTAASVNTGVCPPNLVLSSPGAQPAGGTLTVGSAAWTYVGQLAVAASSGTATLDSIGITNAAAAPLATVSDLTLNLLNAAGTAVDSTGRWDGTKWVFASIVDGSTGLPISIGTTAVTFRVYATASYGAAAGENFAMQVLPANVTALAPATATTGVTVSGNSFAVAAPAAVAVGALADTASPMVSILNPGNGTIVTGAFLVNVYVYSPNGTAVAAKALTTDGSTPTCAADDAALVKDAHAYANANVAMYAKTLSLGIGTYTLKACARNGTGTAIVSPPATITVRAAGAGDGNLLVRDNSSQLCSDCHDQSKIKTHSSESTSTATAPSKYGSWVTNCRDCHTPHSTRNLYLVKEQIVPPGVNGYQAAKNVYFAATTGDSNVSGSATPASSSFANTDGSGPCQVCHTRTMDPGRTYATGGTFTNASTTVTSASAVFKTGAAPTGDVGNWILAPDGRSYQISAVASGTSATIATAYQGATTGTGTAKFIVGPARWRNTGNSDTAHAAAPATTACTGCHSHKGGFGASESSGGGNCSGCHGKIWDLMTATTTTSKHALGNVVGTNDKFSDDATVNWGTQTSLTGILPAQRSCVNMCHDDHVHDLSPSTTHEQDVYTDARNSTSRAMTRDGGGNVTAGTPAKVDFAYNATTQTWGGMCTSCHQTQVDANRPAIAPGTFSGSGHDGILSTDGTSTYTWNYQLHDGSTFNRNCTKCHASRTEGTTPTFITTGSNAGAVHGSATDTSMLSGGKSLQNAATAPFVCWNCHASAAAANGAQGNRSNHDVQAAISKTNNHPVATTDAKHDSVNESSAVYYSGTGSGAYFAGANRHVACVDCHDPHAAGKTNHANGTNAVTGTSPIAGVSGVGFTSPTTNWTATASANFTWKNGVATAVAAEYELCFKCHSSFAYGTTPPTDPSGLVETDQSLEFSTYNQSYHPVVGALPTTDPSATYGSVQLNAAQLCGAGNTNCPNKDPAYTWTPGQKMYCSDCHGSDANAAGVQGPHGSAAKFLLKGPNKYWPTDSTGTNLFTLTSGSAAGSGLFCLNCHPTPTSTNTPHSNGQHTSNTIYCVTCHIAVPHGGKVDRLIATTTAPAPYNYNGNTAAIQGFKRAATYTSYTESGYCGPVTCGYSGHTSFAGSEAW
ncbi:MAG TPA: hypothetical protein VF841_01720 [Anaeromyxobacter sp.]